MFHICSSTPPKPPISKRFQSHKYGSGHSQDLTSKYFLAREKIKLGTVLKQQNWWDGHAPLYQGGRCFSGEDNEDPPKPAEHYSVSVDKHEVDHVKVRLYNDSAVQAEAHKPPVP